DSENLNTGGVVNIVADPSHLYGHRIINDTTLDLFPYLFYSEASMLSIGELTPAGADHHVSLQTEHFDFGLAPASPGANPLRSMQHLPVGYGSSNVVPSGFFLEDGQTLDVGIIKLFTTTSPVSFSLLEQESPFDEEGQDNTRKIVSKSIRTDAGFWDTQFIVVIQHETLQVPTAEPPNNAAASPPLDSNSRLGSLQGAPQVELHPAYNPDKGGDSLQSLQGDAPLREVTTFMVQYALTVEELITCFGDRGCTDITDQLDLESCTTYPLFSGGFGDVYRGETVDGVEVAIKTMRLYVASEDGEKKRLNVSL
ncbi:hypothetical protein FRC10_011611, partial [Ceratobasidium sp. 414]